MKKNEIPKSIVEVFERIQNIGEYKNQSEMIKDLEIMPSFYFKIKRNEQYLSDESASKIAELAKLPIEYVLVMNNMEKSKDKTCRAAYKRVLDVLAYLDTEKE